MTLRLWNSSDLRGFQIGRLGVCLCTRDGYGYVQGLIACYHGWTGLHLRVWRVLVGWRLERRDSVKFCWHWPKSYKL